MGERSRKRDFDSRQQGGGYASRHNSYNDHRIHRGPEQHSYEKERVVPRRTTSTLIKISNLDKKIGAHNIRGYIENISGFTLKSVDLQKNQQPEVNECYIEFCNLNEAEKFMLD